jgi:hypothetical protein
MSKPVVSVLTAEEWATYEHAIRKAWMETGAQLIPFARVMMVDFSEHIARIDILKAGGISAGAWVALVPVGLFTHEDVEILRDGAHNDQPYPTALRAEKYRDIARRLEAIMPPEERP